MITGYNVKPWLSKGKENMKQYTSRNTEIYGPNFHVFSYVCIQFSFEKAK